MRKGVTNSLIKILIVIIVSIIGFVVLIPFISLVIDKGLSSEFVGVMFGILFVGIILDKVIRSKRK